MKSLASEPGLGLLVLTNTGELARSFTLDLSTN